MKRSHLLALSVTLGVAGYVAVRVISLSPAEAFRAAKPTYAPFREASMHRRGCLDPAAREKNRDVDAVRLTVTDETWLELTVHGDAGLVPAVVITADEGAPAQRGWMRELASRGGGAIVTTVGLPAAGSYTFVIADRSDLEGDPMRAGQGCYTADFEPREPPAGRALGEAWLGTIGIPVVFDVAKTSDEVSRVEVSNRSVEGTVMVSAFEDGVYTDTRTIAAGAKQVFIMGSRSAGRLLVEEALNLRSDPLRVLVRPATLSFANADSTAFASFESDAATCMRIPE